MNIAICDDFAYDRTSLAKHVTSYLENTVIWEYEDGLQLVEAHKQVQFDLILLDMLMPIISGIKTAEQIRQFDNKTPIVFVTTTKEFAVQSYHVLAFDYILKPVTDSDISRCFSRFLAQKQKMQF